MASSHDAPASGSSPSASQRDAPGAQGSNSQPRTEQELSQAFRDLARGEQTAAALEANLTSLESKLDELLASFMGAAGEEPAATNGAEEVPSGTEEDGHGARGGQDTADK